MDVTARLTSPHHGRDHPSAVDLPHPMVGLVGEVDLATRADRELLRRVDLGRDGRAAVAAEARTPRASDGPDGAALDDADAVVAAVRNVQAPGRVQGQVDRAEELGLFRRSTVPLEPRAEQAGLAARAGHG